MLIAVSHCRIEETTMDTKMIKGFIFVSIIALMGAGCGNDGYSSFPGPVTTLDGFRVVNSDPFYNDEFVPITKDIRAMFNEPVDQNTVAANVKVNQTIGLTGTDITASGSLSLVDGNATVVFVPSKPLA